MEGHTSDDWTGTASDVRKSLIHGSPSSSLPPTAPALGTKLRASAHPCEKPCCWISHSTGLVPSGGLGRDFWTRRVARLVRQRPSLFRRDVTLLEKPFQRVCDGLFSWSERDIQFFCRLMGPDRSASLQKRGSFGSERHPDSEPAIEEVAQSAKGDRHSMRDLHCGQVAVRNLSDHVDHLPKPDRVPGEDVAARTLARFGDCRMAGGNVPYVAYREVPVIDLGESAQILINVVKGQMRMVRVVRTHYCTRVCGDDRGAHPLESDGQSSRPRSSMRYRDRMAGLPPIRE